MRSLLATALLLVAPLAAARPAYALSVSVSVPEPSSIALLAAGLVGLGGLAASRRWKGPKQ
jgi:hypothetical protein